MRDKVVYILGAGFSAPLGIPVMGNFLEKSRDMYFEKPGGYEWFENVFATIRKLSYAKNYFETDLTNVEEVLSILEMDSHLGSSDEEQQFEEYIKAVIDYYTPTPERIDSSVLVNKDWDSIFGSDLWSRYCYFVGSLLGLTIRKNLGPASIETRDSSKIGPEVIFKREGVLDSPPNPEGQESQASYTVVTLNYDMVLERCLECIEHATGKSLSFDASSVQVSKIHGSVDSSHIIPPTWNKGLGEEGVHASWKTAHKAIRKANRIRVIGYSLPKTDSYIKYLFRSAVARSRHLKEIDVLCLDPDGSVEERYKDFVTYKKLRFVSERTEEYLKHTATPYSQGHSYHRFDDGRSGKGTYEATNLISLESNHERFFASQDG